MALDGQNETFIARIKDAVPVSDGKKKFTVYLAEVKPPWFYNVPPYTVHRRYREFLALYKDLCNMFGKGQIAVPFPKKKALGSMGASVVNYRKGALQAFFDAVSANEKMGKHKLIQDFLAHRPGEDPPKPSPQKQKVKPQAAKKAEAPTEGVVVAGSKRTEAAAAMRVAAATPGMKSAAGAGTGHNQPPVHQDEEEIAAEAKAKAEAERKAKKAADAKARADAEAERKAQLEMERKAAAEKREKEAAEQKAKAAAERAAKAEAEQAAPAPTPTPASSTPAATAVPPPTAAPNAGATEWPTLPGLSQRLIREAEKALTGGDFGGAAEGFDEAIGSLDEGQAEFHIVRCELWVKRADCLLHDGQARLAATELTKALELVPGHPEALLRRARAMQQREKFREAFTDFQDCVVHRGPTERAARAGLQEVIKMLDQLGDGSWVRQNRKV